jgi:protoporphyrinogen oxidase
MDEAVPGSQPGASVDHPQAVIIGAGPAGLTAAFELLARTSFRPLVIEAGHNLGGISATIRYKGNRIDIGGHRFFSKSDRVLNWWLSILPLQTGVSPGDAICYRAHSHVLSPNGAGPDPEKEDRVMLLRRRRSRIYFEKQLLPYPLQLDVDLIRALGLGRSLRMMFSYLHAMARPIRPERSLEDFLVNRFGRALFLTFFKEYTEKVWGVPCHEISADWGAQRIKRLSALSALWHTIRPAKPADTHTSLIERFLYPKYGPGQMWEEVASRIETMGGRVLLGWKAVRLLHDGARINAVEVVNPASGETASLPGDLFFSTMPLGDLVEGLTPSAPAEARRIAAGLPYRAFVTVGLLCRDLQIEDRSSPGKVLDNWIYIQSAKVRVGRLQLYNNWSPYMVADPNLAWVGLEYFCDEDDTFWNMTDGRILDLARREASEIGLVRPGDVLDGVVVRMPKAYPAYWGTYPELATLRRYLDSFENLIPIGRNGTHRYNNQDHSMLAAMTAVDQLVAGKLDRDTLWSLDVEASYLEEK